jgi:putative membrane protein
MLVCSLVITLALYIAGVTRVWHAAGAGRGVEYWQVACFAAGWLAMIVALSPWMDQLSDAWLSAHMVQHELLMVIAAPLIAISAPLAAMLWVVPARGRRGVVGAIRGRATSAGWQAATMPGAAWLLHAAALWTWHLPRLYDFALQHEAVHAAEHVCFFGTAALFWWTVAHGRYGRLGYGASVVYVFATALHSGLLGALLTFAPHVWFPAYALPHGGWLTPLEDQQLAGLLMWVPAGLVLVAGGLFFLAAWIRESERRAELTFRTTPL